MTRVPHEVDALVLGAGPAGAATATWLAEAGHRVVLIDRARFPRDKACAEYMSPETLRWLDRLGVLGDLDRAPGVPIRGTTVVGPYGSRLTGRFSQAHPTPFRPTGLSITRRILDHRLVQRARAAGVDVREETAATDLLFRGRAVSGALVRGPSGGAKRIEARLTVGADGLRSMVARVVGKRRYGRPRRLAFVAHMSGVRDLAPGAEMHVGHAGYAGLNPVGDELANVALVVPRAKARLVRGQVREFFFHQLAKFPGLRGRLDPAGLAREVLVTGPFSAWSTRVIADGVVMVGDAADFFDPFTGEGICTALRGAWLASQTAGAALSRPSLVRAADLKPYARARGRAFRGKWMVERLIGHGMIVPRLFDRAVDRIGRRPPMADTMIGVTGDFVPPRAVLNPWYLTRMVI
ncbi:MAG: FAD-binding protein [Gemmatimonadales bacterium]|nr:FAD-binding protein [Gemmatimonadales bacterium]